MNHRGVRSTALLLFALLAPNSIPVSAANRGSDGESISDALTPMVRVLVDPQRYEGKNIAIAGVFGTTDGGSAAIYLDEGSARADVSANRILLPSRPDLVDQFGGRVTEFDDRYVEITGVLQRAEVPGVLFRWQLQQVSNIRMLGRRRGD